MGTIVTGERGYDEGARSEQDLRLNRWVPYLKIQRQSFAEYLSENSYYMSISHSYVENLA